MTDFNNHPQPRTFAPSKEDVLQNLQYFFGAPVSPEKLKDYSEHHAMTCAPPPARTPSLDASPPSLLTPAYHSPFPFICGAQTIFRTRMRARTRNAGS